MGFNTVSEESLIDLQLGGHSQRLDLSSAVDINLVASHMLSQATRSLYLICPELDRKIFDQDNFSSALYDLARYSRNSDIRILIHDSTDAIRNGHSLVNLAKRLSSYIEVRTLGDDYKSFDEAFMVFDKRGIIYQGRSKYYDAMAEHHHPRLAQELEKTFLDMWNHSHVDPNFRQLHI